MTPSPQVPAGAVSSRRGRSPMSSARATPVARTGEEVLDEPFRVMVVCLFMPHYRSGVHLALDASDRVSYTFLSDPCDDHYSVATMPTESVRHHHLLINRHIARLTWQQGLVKHVLTGKHDAYVFWGDASVASTWVAAACARLLLRRPVFYWTIGWHRPESGLKKLTRMAFYRLADQLLLYGSTARELGRGMGYPLDRMSVIGNSEASPGSDVDPVDPLPMQAPGHHDGRRVSVGAVARLNHAKRFDLLIEAAGVLVGRGLRVEVTLAGDGPCAEALVELAQQRGVDLRLLGPVYGREDLATLYRQLDMTVVPAHAGLTIIQSLKNGVPVITDDDIYMQGPEWEAVTPDVTGGLYAKGDVAGLADAIETWAARVHSAPEDVSRRCVAEYRAKWTPVAHARRIEQGVLQVLSRRRSRSR